MFEGLGSITTLNPEHQQPLKPYSPNVLNPPKSQKPRRVPQNKALFQLRKTLGPKHPKSYAKTLDPKPKEQNATLTRKT